MFTIILEFGRCGFGFDAGLIPDLRLGLIRVAWTRGSILGRFRSLRDKLAGRVSELRR